MAVQDPSIGTILEKFESISTNNDVSESMALRSMQILYRCIRLCFPDGKILVLIDNYDSIFEKIYLSPGFNYDSEDARKIKLFIRDFLKKTCQKPASFPGYRMVKQLKVIITGVTHVPGSDFFPDLDDSTEWSMTNSGIYPYYGFTSDEVEQLANLRSVDYYYMKSLLQNTYDGYRDISCPDQPLFNPVSVIEFLNHRGPVSFWSKDEGNTLREILFQLSKNLEMVYLFGLLLIGKPIKISASANQGIPIDKIDNIAAAIRGEFVRVLDDRSIHQIFSFLLSYEYLTLATKQPPNASFFNAKLSRKEIKDVSMKAFLQNHLTARLLHHHQYLINDTILAFGNYIEDSSDKSNEQLKVTISRLFDKTGPLKNFKTAIERYKNEKPKGEFVNVVFNDVEESAARGILAHVLVKLQYNGILNVSMDEEQVVERESNEFNFKICMLGYDEEGRVIIIKHEHVEEDSVEEYDLQQAVKDNAHLIQKIISSPLKYCKIVTLNTFNSNDLKMNFQVINAI
ncbi:uncharacterized protein LOC135847053 [Planococcus citri]|uniref:uncharacterized protein LOC135847053 n=1 Tax=Planococcus citri TaxID=170843 RepID=UPI0031F8FA2D